MGQIGISAEPETRYLESDGKAYPNNPNLPFLIYRGIFRSDQGSLIDSKHPFIAIVGQAAGDGVSTTSTIITAMLTKLSASPKARRGCS